MRTRPFLNALTHLKNILLPKVALKITVSERDLGDNPDIREDPLVSPAVVDCAIVAARMTSAPPLGAPRDRPSHSQSASLYVLSTLLPPTTSAFADALLHSASAFRLLDRLASW